MKKSGFGLSVVLCVFLSGCASTPAPQKTQLEIREFQTRSYTTSDSKMVLKAVLNVLQDDGYIVKNASAELGLLNATKEYNVEQGGEAFWSTFWFGQNAHWKKNSIIEATANVTEFGAECRVRVNFQVKIMDNRGAVMDVRQIEDQKFYQEFFAKVDKGVFIQKEKI